MIVTSYPFFGKEYCRLLYFDIPALDLTHTGGGKEEVVGGICENLNAVAPAVLWVLAYGSPTVNTGRVLLLSY